MIKFNSEFIFTKKIGLLTYPVVLPTHSLGKSPNDFFRASISIFLGLLYSRDIFRVVPQWGHDVGGHVHQLAEVAWTWNKDLDEDGDDFDDCDDVHYCWQSCPKRQLWFCGGGCFTLLPVASLPNQSLSDTLCLLRVIIMQKQ